MKLRATIRRAAPRCVRRPVTTGIGPLAALAIVVLPLAASPGCSRPKQPPLGTVEGIVTLDGSPLAAAAVLFTPDGPGRTSIGVTAADGRYSLTYLRDIKGADLGRHKVRITTATDDNGGRERLPQRYHAKSELSATVTPGSNEYDFPLTSKP
jgi:hypothetical protein